MLCNRDCRLDRRMVMPEALLLTVANVIHSRVPVQLLTNIQVAGCIVHRHEELIALRLSHQRTGAYLRFLLLLLFLLFLLFVFLLLIAIGILRRRIQDALSVRLSRLDWSGKRAKVLSHSGALEARLKADLTCVGPANALEAGRVAIRADQAIIVQPGVPSSSLPVNQRLPSVHVLLLVLLLTLLLFNERRSDRKSRRRGAFRFERWRLGLPVLN